MVARGRGSWRVRGDLVGRALYTRLKNLGPTL